MTRNSKMITASAATLFALALFVMSAPAASADDYCIMNGAQAAHGCGYPSMEMCQQDAAGIGGSCSQAPAATSTSNALAYQPKRHHARSQPKQPVGN